MSMLEQLNLFAIGKFCENEKINILADLIEEVMSPLENEGIHFTEKSYEVWEHVPQYGKRLMISYKVDDKKIPFQNPPSKIDSLLKTVDLEKPFKFAAKNKIELSISPNPFLIMFTTYQKGK